MNRDDINKEADWMMQRGYATGHGETMEDLLAELDWQIAENWNRAMINGIETEREACAKFIEQEYVRQFDEPWRDNLAKAIRARREQ